jgi:hypothetical protein
MSERIRCKSRLIKVEAFQRCCATCIVKGLRDNVAWPVQKQWLRGGSGAQCWMAKLRKDFSDEVLLCVLQ